MMKRFCAVSPSVCLVLALVSDPRAAEAAFERQVSGGRSAGMGSAIVTGSPDAWSATVHCALLGFVHRPSIESQVQPSPFGLSELSRAGIAAVLPFGPGALALSGMRQGRDLCRETEAGLSVGIRLYRILLIGGRIRWCHLSFSGYGSAAAFACDLSIAAVPLDGLVLATLVQGVNRPTIGETRERLPTTIMLGISYRPVNSIEIAVELDFKLKSHERVQAQVQQGLVRAQGVLLSP